MSTRASLVVNMNC